MAGRIPQHFIDELIGRADIVEVVGARVALTRGGREYKGLCPFHGEKTPSFTVSPDKGFYHCFGCGAHGTALGFLMDHDHLGFIEAVEQLAGMVGMEVPRDAGDEKLRGSDRVIDLLRRVAEFYQRCLREHEPAAEYLKSRGIDGETARDYAIGYAPDGWDTLASEFGSDTDTETLLQAGGLVIRRDDGGYYDRFRDRVIFPIRDGRGRVVGFGGRVLGKGEPKYLNSPETVVFSKRRELYGLYEVRRRLRDIPRLIVVEGYMDVVALARNGVDNAVATLGTATTDEHLKRLFRMTDEVVFCFDGDRAGRQAAWRALEVALPEARDGHQMRFAFLPDGEDPDSLVKAGGSQALERELDAALSLSDFMVDELSNGLDKTSLDGRAQLAERAKPLLAKVPAGVYRELLIERLADEVGLAGAKLTELMKPAKSAAQPAPAPARSKRRPPQQLTLIARTIRALLHRPSLSDAVDPANLADLTRPGTELLLELLETAQSDPNLSPAALLERMRPHANFRHLERLLGSEFIEHDELDLAAEFDGCIRQLRTEAVEMRIAALRSRGAANLSDAEQRELLVELPALIQTLRAAPVNSAK
ncbi:MAG: DNA primase [Pseudomonadota bacterium]